DTGLSRLKIADAGDVPKRLSLQEAHTRLEESVASALKAGAIPFVVGGGNDQSYPNASALLGRASGETGVVNIDAHLDVRPLKQGKAHSGSPFRLLLEDPRFSGKNFLEFAAQGSQCSREHADYIYGREGHILWLQEAAPGGGTTGKTFKRSLDRLAERCSSIFVSFDLDSIAACHAPGVSCPGVLGLSAEDAVAIARHAGAHPAVALFDLSEYNPLIEEELTGRLAAAIFYYFCLGVASRKEGK
ncbi:MAG: formimidoylglutamase, partial [bacterium]